MRSETPRCGLARVPLDLEAKDWSEQILAKSSGFSPDRPTFWVAEGVLYYLPLDSVKQILGELLKLCQGPLGLFCLYF